MKRHLQIIALLVLALVAGHGACAEPASAASFAEAMMQTRYSDGFEARMNVSVFKPDGEHVTTFKFAVIGQIGKDRQRLLIRGITPKQIRNRYIAAERDSDGHIRATSYSDATIDYSSEFDPASGLFGSGMVLWDMFAPWWNWPRQEWVKNQIADTSACTAVHSQTENNLPVREVVSCVDRDAKLALNTQLFGRRHKLLRTITVVHTMRKGSGALAAKELTITTGDGTVTEVAVYSGDENYDITADTFAALEAKRNRGN